MYVSENQKDTNTTKGKIILMIRIYQLSNKYTAQHRRAHDVLKVIKVTKPTQIKLPQDVTKSAQGWKGSPVQHGATLAQMLILQE
uniref:Uncharacterized protein n=1 Tax=Arundo donax TaxID=35708 RepID=A0A0A9GP00_ARUDO